MIILGVLISNNLEYLPWQGKRKGRARKKRKNRNTMRQRSNCIRQNLRRDTSRTKSLRNPRNSSNGALMKSSSNHVRVFLPGHGEVFPLLEMACTRKAIPSGRIIPKTGGRNNGRPIFLTL